MSVSLIDGHIDDDVLTDEQIIKALECCANHDNVDACDDCPCLKGECISTTSYVLDLINRQKAEIENMNNLVVYNATCATKLQLKLVEAKAEAIKKFAERLKENKIDIDVSFGYGREVYTEAVAVIEIDNLVKEMVGEPND